MATRQSSAPSLRGLSREQRGWGSVLSYEGHPFSQTSEIFASSPRGGAKAPYGRCHSIGATHLVL